MAKLNTYKTDGIFYPHRSDFSIPQIPTFKRLHGSLTRIASPAGVTYLKTASIKSGVYLGSKIHAVDIEGTPWLRKSELKKITAGEKRPKKKLASVETPAFTNFPTTGVNTKIENNLSTEESTLLTITPELPTISRPKQPVQYKLKKSLVRNRLLAYTNTKKGNKCLYFFTVTFPLGMSDDMGYRALNTWFTALRKQRLLHEYLWVAERQKNGTVHFHIAVPHFMRVWHVNGVMRKILRNYAIAKELPFPPEKFGRGKYNGVDIAGYKDAAGHKVPTNFAHKKKSGSLANYLTKYVTKNNESFGHLAWHNSRGFSALFLSIALSRESFQLSGLHNKLNWSKRFDSLGKDGTAESGLFVFVPWRGNAPPEFWRELNKPNNFFQSLDL